MKPVITALLCATILAGQPRPARKKTAPAPKPAAPPAARVFPIVSLSVEGNAIHASEKILTLAGLKTGMPVSKEAFEAARDRLIACGFFETVGYKYGPSADGAGYAATFTVDEVKQVYPMRFERLPGGEKEFRAALAAADPLFGDKVPGTEPVLKRYAAVIQKQLGGKFSDRVIGKVTADGPDDLRIVFQPGTPPPSVAEVRFVKNEVIASTALQNRIAGAAIGSIYDEDRFRQILNANVRPMYEARGRIRVAFPKVTTEPAPGVNGLRVTVEVNEGETYKLGEVTAEAGGIPPAMLLKAAALKTGDIANFDEINAGVERMRQLVRRNGYLNAKSTIGRKPDDEKKTVDLAVTFDPGQKFVFGKLTIVGLDILTEPHIRKMWAPKEGEPFNPEYPDFFMAKLREDNVLENLGKTRTEVKTDDARGVADVTLHFR